MLCWLMRFENIKGKKDTVLVKNKFNMSERPDKGKERKESSGVIRERYKRPLKRLRKTVHQKVGFGLHTTSPWVWFMQEL